ncbi:CheR family methyltransferase [Pendulispora albinea]|uniref:PAS domain-containing protein n=1 Tax=Pendulispora albinea TaxID=2741071 RepID=A0ABZ2LUL4_9BACT
MVDADSQSPAGSSDDDVSDVAASAKKSEDDGSDFFIVGIGASAGGIEALTELVEHISFDHLALVVVQHLAPEQESYLAPLLSRNATIDVVTVEDGMRVAANCIYVIPPGANLALLQGVLHLMPHSTAPGPAVAIDFFFRSLAEDQGARAVGVVLSGTGADGTLGLKAIKEAGGITMAQDPATAKYDGMPRSALASGVVDFCLGPRALANELMSIGSHPYITERRPPRPKAEVENIAKLVLLIRSVTGNDLTYYKPSTIERRIERRLALHKIERLADYIKFAQSNHDEVRALYKDILISVTSFFRDPAVFDVLKSQVFPRITENNKRTSPPLRIWIPACSTGEEPYSIAIALLEYLDDRAHDYRIQIFATDVDETSVNVARRGIYPQNITLDVSPERLRRFFVKKDADYQICRRVRDMIVFSSHNITKDAPFSRLDLVSCRNLLIYLQPVMQKKVLRILHYSLNPNAYLLLGTSESVGDSPDLFSLVDRKNKVYAAKHVPTQTSLDVGFGTILREPPLSNQPTSGARPILNIAALADRKVLDTYGPPGVVINENLEILHFRGRTGSFFEPAPGAASLNILRLARPELQPDIRRTIHQAIKENARVSTPSKITEDGKIRSLMVEAIPIVEPETKSKCIIVSFCDVIEREVRAVEAEAAAAPVATHAQEARLQDVERELTVTREYLQSIVEELESANEELKSSNEELQSSNEELQSTNEELETSKEELQSANEELTTVNDELQTRMLEQQLTNDDLHNVLNSVDSILVITGLDMRIRRFTYAAEKHFNLLPGDVGRSVSHLNPFLGGLKLDAVGAEVIETLVPFNREVQASDQRWYIVRVTPYKTLEHSITGVVISLNDIDVRHRALQLGQDVAEYAGTFLDVIGHALLIIDGKTKVVWANRNFYPIFRLEPDRVIGKSFAELPVGPWSTKRLQEFLEGALVTGGAFRDVHISYPFGDELKSVRVSGSRMPPMNGDTGLILLSFEDGP